MNPKFIFVSGGVISGLGKGITTASISLLLQSRGFKVLPVKCDPYLNLDAGTMNPLEHGEIFVLDDGMECDQDLGHYERFLGISLTKENYMTGGQVYKSVLDRERALEYDGKCVDAYLHIPQEIINRLEKVGKKAEIVIVEFGGTVGEYQNIMFFEAARRMKIKYKENVLFVHVGYLPIPHFLGEMKTKPLQQSVWALHSLGIQPDIIVCRAEKEVDFRRREKIAFACSLEPEDIFANPDVENIYEVPLILEKQKITERIMKKLKIKGRRRNLKEWRNLIKKIKNLKRKVKIGIAGKYYTSGDFCLEDSYVSVVEAVKHASWANNVWPEIIWFDTEKIEKEGLPEKIKECQGIIVPQGWGSRGVEGKIKVVQYARENKIPYLGLCFGMQMAVIEFARNVLGLKDANSTEVNPQTPYPVIHIMPDQEKYLKKRQFGGTIRLGAWPCKLKRDSLVWKCYHNNFKFKILNLKFIYERHRHRYEFNNQYREKFKKAGMVFSGVSPDGKLVEAIEIPNHPFFVGTQFHPEYKSLFLKPHPLFLEFIREAVKK
ncbi:MAG: CTP synthase [Microgenomates group bacterium]